MSIKQLFAVTHLGALLQQKKQQHGTDLEAEKKAFYILSVRWSEGKHLGRVNE